MDTTQVSGHVDVHHDNGTGTRPASANPARYVEARERSQLVQATPHPGAVDA
ncbi:hypothetical protein [Streptomyces bullii]|uniref:Uncharacterized protein n=1 Tax=Streptomyces bullii TaxID=349910 RepID=A0ABW0UIJ2_9ACTN